MLAGDLARNADEHDIQVSTGMQDSSTANNLNDKKGSLKREKAKNVEAAKKPVRLCEHNRRKDRCRNCKGKLCNF